MKCPNCGKETEIGWMMPNKICSLTWAPKRYQFPFPRKGETALRSPEEGETRFDTIEYPAQICKACKIVIFQYE